MTLSAEIKKTIKAKKVYGGDLSIAPREIDKEYLQRLFEKLGIPEHFSNVATDPNSQYYNKVAEDFRARNNDTNPNAGRRKRKADDGPPSNPASPYLAVLTGISRKLMRVGVSSV